MLNAFSARSIWLGRSPEVSALTAGLEALVEGRGSLFLVTGEPGIGKTRLADEVGQRAAARGVVVHWGRAWEVGGAPSFWPFIQALRGLSHDRGGDEAFASHAATGSPVDLGALVMPARTAVDRFELFAWVDAYLRAAAETPRLIVLDDLHAADAPSLQLLHFLAPDLRARPLMILGTFREAEARLAPEIGALLTRVARNACVLPLRPFERGEVASYIRQATGSEPSEARVDELHRVTEGNPLFLRELLQLGGHDARRSDGIRHVVRARLGLLPDETRALLEVAAVLGREFGAAPLARLADIPEVEARARLEPAAHAAIVEALDDPPRWRFTHVLLRQGLYDDLAGERRAALHHACAADLARRRAPPPAELAHHLYHALPIASPLDAAGAALRAADHAMELLAYEDALAFYTNAGRLTQDVSGAERLLFGALLGAGLAHMRMAEVDRGKEACRRAAVLARSLGDADGFARAVLGPGYEHVPWARDATWIALLEEALEVLPPGDGALRAQCMAELAAIRLPEADPRPIVSLAREAVAMARRVGDPGALRTTLSAASLATASHVEPADRMTLHAELLRLSLAAGDTRMALRAHGFLAGNFLELGELAGMEPHLHALERLAGELRHGQYQWLALLLRGLEALLQGRFDAARDALAELEAVLARDEARGALLAGGPASFACITERYDDLGRLESRTRAAFDATQHELGSFLGELVITQLHARAGDADRVAARLRTLAANPWFEAIQEPAWLTMLADACHLMGDRALAERLYPALLPCAARFVWLGPLAGCVEPPFSRQLGLLAETLGRFDDAVRHFEAAEQSTTRAQMRAHYARIWYELARALLSRDRAGDRARALELVERAHGLATELGQPGLLPRLEALRVTAAARAGGAAARADDASKPALAVHRDGETWFVAWGELNVRLRDSRGVALLAKLVEHCGQELHVLQLVAEGDGAPEGGDAGPHLDPRAVQSYRRRLLDLREELEDAQRVEHATRADEARAEIEHLTRELARAVGLGGRERRAGQAAERARTAVQKRLREIIRRIEGEAPELGRHLAETIRTGMFCAYLPDRRRVSGGAPR